MANSKDNGEFKRYATVDTDPADGYFTDEVSIRKLAKTNKLDKIYFSVREASDSESVDTSVITVTLQFKCSSDGRWQDYYNDGSDIAIGDRKQIEDTGADVFWRAGVKEGDYTSGSVTFGFDW